MDRQLLKDKVVVLIGASAGLGKAMSETFLEEGACLVMVGRGADKLKACEDEIRKEGDRILTIPADFASREDAVKVFEEAIKEFGKVDVLVTNASRVGKCISLEATPDKEIDEIIDTDVKGLLFYNREAMKHFIERDSGCIINVGSNNIGRPICDSVYCTAKYAEWGLTRQLAIRCVGTGVRVNLLNPGSFPSQSGIGNTSGASHMYDAGELVQASGRIPVPEGSMINIMKARTNRAVPVDLKQVAFAAAYLASDMARDVNGQCFTVDRGGYM